MQPKQSTIGEIIESERALVLEAPDRYGAFYVHALDASVLLASCLRSGDISQEIFLRFLAQVKKHHTLALFSTVRLHKVQAMMNLRQVLEAAACAAYAIRNPDPMHFVDVTEDGLLDPSQALTGRRYKRLDEHFPAGSASIKGFKLSINQTTAHANYLSTSHNFELPEGAAWASAPFFDVADEHFIKTDLWLIGNVAICVMDLFYGVAQGQAGIVFADGFERDHSQLAAQNSALRDEMMATDRYKRAMERQNASSSGTG